MIGTLAGSYRIVDTISVGGMGTVYRAEHTLLGRPAAVKVLNPEMSTSRDIVNRFFNEARATTSIKHPGIIEVFDFGYLESGHAYLVMELLEGAPLSTRNRARPRIPEFEAAAILRLICSALTAAHAKGIVHRDLKPDNIFVTPSGRAKVLDFGIAKLQPELGGSATHTGSLLGTPHYMSPEQAAGRAVDLRADIYAIGVILFECVTLQQPFKADALFDLLRKHIEAPPPSPRALRPDLPVPVEQIIYQALAKPPDHRFASAQAMSMALQQATASLPAPAWAPIVGGGRPSSGGWQPSLPPSWTGRTAPSTATAGEVAAAPARSSSKVGMWIAVAGVTLIGGGIAAVMVASGRHGTSDAVMPPSTPVAQQAPAATPAAPPPTAPPPTAPPPAAPASATVAPPPTAPTSPPARGQTPSTPPSPPPAKLATDDDTSRPAPGRDATGWVANRRFPSPFDPSHVDVAKAQTWALAEAKKIVPDAVLFRIDADGVFADGHADLKLVNGSLDFRFISPSRSKRDPAIPVGVKQEWKCMFRVEIDTEGAWSAPMDGWECKEPLIGPPHCSAVEVWKKMIAMKAPATAVAELGYRAPGPGRPTWYVDIHDADAPFSEMFPDDCRYR